MKAPQFEDYSYGGMGRGLLCPGCNGVNLHHHKVEVFERDAEDASTGRRVTVEAYQVSVTGDMTGNPSARRDGMRVAFWCETCSALSELTIVQHKGTTYLAMAVTGEDTSRADRENPTVPE